MSTEAKGFVIHSTARSGSTFIIVTLRKHPQIMARADVFAGQPHATQVPDTAWLGNLLVFGAVVCEGAYAVIGKKLTGAISEGHARRRRRCCRRQRGRRRSTST